MPQRTVRRIDEWRDGWKIVGVDEATSVVSRADRGREPFIPVTAARWFAALLAASACVLALVACGSDRPTREEASSLAVSEEAVRARHAEVRRVGARLTAVVEGTRSTAVETSTSDICRLGVTHGLWPHDPFRVRCSWSEVRYLRADGDLVEALRDVDIAAKEADCLPDSVSNIEGVVRYLERDGKYSDGRQMSLPSLVYACVEAGRMHVHWFADNAPPVLPSFSFGPAVVFDERYSVDRMAVWADLRRERHHLITLGMGEAYFEVPWTD
ncbi:hypothetical protein [Salinispora cortesiana]|uniref:hypothetical protein n=1 Tax=Salinispora cortesiana TaxID=1305843 RepID=UPI0012BD55D0|nr:hypothetical protein [Salinispora cortesiana]